LILHFLHSYVPPPDVCTPPQQPPLASDASHVILVLDDDSWSSFGFDSGADFHYHPADARLWCAVLVRVFEVLVCFLVMKSSLASTKNLVEKNILSGCDVA
jgi:hypothetical protein